MKYPVALPKTTFGIKSNKNDEILSFWKEISLYKKLSQRDSEKFLLHDGPPFANGAPHMGHAVNKIMKDIFNRGKALLGYKLDFIPGWDCHGLPIEAAVEAALKKSGKRRSELNISEFRELCADFASKWIEVQKEGFIRMGVIGDFENPYKTMDSQLEILKEFHKFVADGLIYRGSKPVMWSCSEATALAEAEVEYQDKKSNAVYVKLEIIKHDTLAGCKVVIWTTTPWTLPANRAVAYGADFEYVICETDNEKLIVAKDLYDDFCNKINDSKIIRTFSGTELHGAICKHPMHSMGFEIEIPVLESDHVSLDQGTGLVHIAPSHGEEDFVLGKKFDLEVPELIDAKGNYKPDVPFVGGENIFESEDKIIDELRKFNILVSHEKITHSYPHSWRSRKPLIYRVTPQWFISIDKMKKNTLSAIDDVNWIPDFGKMRFKSMLENRGDWCVSRQRVWGVPLATLYNEETGETLSDPQVLKKIQDKLEENGVGAWWSIASEIAKDYPGYVPTYDILDVWFESGASQSYVLNGEKADVYFEGSDQHRGWFQSSALQASRESATLPYKNLITHGFVVDKHGKKMSKSLGNGVDPIEIIETHGADLIRLWISNQNYTEDLRWSLEHLNRVKDMEKRFRNTIKYALGSIQFGFEHGEMPMLEQYILHKLYVLNEEFKDAVNEFTTYKFMKKLFLFCTVDLSAFYFDIRKDVLYCDDVNNELSKSIRMVLKYTLDCLVRWLAPIMTFATEEAWHAMGNTGSIHEEKILDLDAKWFNKDIEDKMENIREIRKVVTSALEIMRENKDVNASTEAEVIIICDTLDKEFEMQMKEICIVSNVRIFNANEFAIYKKEMNLDQETFTLNDVKDVEVVTKKAAGIKCPRCKKVYENTEELCERCETVVKNWSDIEGVN